MQRRIIRRASSSQVNLVAGTRVGERCVELFIEGLHRVESLRESMIPVILKRRPGEDKVVTRVVIGC
jgi:hypothetical protein